MRYFIALLALLIGHSYFKGEEIKNSKKTSPHYYSRHQQADRDGQYNVTLDKIERNEEKRIEELENELSKIKAEKELPRELKEFKERPNFNAILTPKSFDFYAENITNDEEVAETSRDIILKPKKCIQNKSCIPKTAKSSKDNLDDTSLHRHLNSALTAMSISIDRSQDLQIDQFLKLDETIDLLKINNSKTRTLALDLIVESKKLNENKLSDLFENYQLAPVEDKKDLYLSLASSRLMRSPSSRKLIVENFFKEIDSASATDVRILTENLHLLENNEYREVAIKACQKVKESKAYNETARNLTLQAEGRGIQESLCN